MRPFHLAYDARPALLPERVSSGWARGSVADYESSRTERLVSVEYVLCPVDQHTGCRPGSVGQLGLNLVFNDYSLTRLSCKLIDVLCCAQVPSIVDSSLLSVPS